MVRTLTSFSIDSKEGLSNLQIQLNNIEKSCEYMVKLEKEMASDMDRVFQSESDKAKIKSCLGSFLDYATTFSETLKVGE